MSEGWGKEAIEAGEGVCLRKDVGGRSEGRVKG